MYFNKFTLLCLIMTFLSACQNKENSNAYKYVEIEECFIPVPKQYKLVEKYSEYTYHYVNAKNEISMDGLSVFKKKKDSYIKAKKTIENISNKIVSEKDNKGFKVLETQAMKFPLNSKLYYLFGDSSVIIIHTPDPKEVENLLNHCKQTRK